METELPRSYKWFTRLELTRFVPWQFDRKIEQSSYINERYRIECEKESNVLTFGRRQDMDTFAGFEVVDGIVSGKVIEFHLSFCQNEPGWNTIRAEYSDFFDFMKRAVLPDMQNFITGVDDVEDYC